MTDQSTLPVPGAVTDPAITPLPIIDNRLPGEATKQRESAASVFLPPLVLGVVFIGFWYLSSMVLLEKGKRFLLKPPHKVIQKGFLNGENFSEMMQGLFQSAKVALIGLAIAALLGMILATIMSQSKFFERAIFPYSVMLQSVPILAITPLIGVVLGYGTNSRIFVCVLIAIFPIIVNTLFGLVSAEQGMHDLFTLHKTRRLTRLRKLMFPAALPAIFTGLRISAGLSVIGSIVGDFIFGQGPVGIGQLIKRYAAKLYGEQLMAGVIVSCLFGVIVFSIFGWVGNRVVGKWATTSRGTS
jgi:NitT/TauT family transport system permease protein